MITAVRALATKHRHLALQFIRYLLVAFIGLGFDFGTLVFCKQILGINYLLAAVAGFSVGLVVNYLLSVRYVFTNPKIKSHAMNFGLFAVIGLIGLGTLTLCMWLLTGGLHINYIISKVIATVFVYMWNFFARRTLYHNEPVPTTS
jgi:putative flippase GtrA